MKKATIIFSTAALMAGYASGVWANAQVTGSADTRTPGTSISGNTDTSIGGNADEDDNGMNTGVAGSTSSSATMGTGTGMRSSDTRREMGADTGPKADSYIGSGTSSGNSGTGDSTGR